jgi:hypothetical protein
LCDTPRDYLGKRAEEEEKREKLEVAATVSFISDSRTRNNVWQLLAI